MTKRILVTGAAGFIGFHVARRLLVDGRSVVGVDNLDPYYDVRLKRARLAELSSARDFMFRRLDLADRASVEMLFADEKPQQIIHLAAQPGVRYSLTNPRAYLSANIDAFLNVLEGCRHVDCRHLVYASSSSVYGANSKVPFSTKDDANHPVSLYGATKKSNEVMAHAYSHLFGIPTTGLRFFTVYGPWGRPDMATWLFTEAIMEGRPIKLFNQGRLRRDFTYVDDIVEAIVRLIDKPAQRDPSWDPSRPTADSSAAPWRLYNIGNHATVEVTELVAIIERAVGRPAITELVPMQPGDVVSTYADVDALAEAVGFVPGTPLEEGMRQFVTWYRDYRSKPQALREPLAR